MFGNIASLNTTHQIHRSMELLDLAHVHWWDDLVCEQISKLLSELDNTDVIITLHQKLPEHSFLLEDLVFKNDCIHFEQLDSCITSFILFFTMLVSHALVLISHPAQNSYSASTFDLKELQPGLLWLQNVSISWVQQLTSLSAQSFYQ